MIVLPNSYERYLTSLRIFVSFSIFKNGLKRRHVKNLKKIALAEAFYHKNFKQSVSVYKLSANLLAAAKTVTPVLKFKIDAKQNVTLNKALFEWLLLSVINQADHLEISTAENHITIKTNIAPKNVKPVIKALNGYSICELNTSNTLIIIPAKKTHVPSVYIESEWELLFDKFSIFNIFFENIVGD